MNKFAVLLFTGLHFLYNPDLVVSEYRFVKTNTLKVKDLAEIVAENFSK